MKHLILLLTCMLLVVACSSDSEEEVKAGKYGMMSSDTPQHNAVLFLRAIYNEASLDKALAMSEERFARILSGYYTNSGVQRQLFNLRLDSMEAEPLAGGTMLFSDRQEKADIQVRISGTFNGNNVTDLKTLTMIKIDGAWKVTDVKNTYP